MLHPVFPLLLPAPQRSSTPSSRIALLDPFGSGSSVRMRPRIAAWRHSPPRCPTPCVPTAPRSSVVRIAEGGRSSRARVVGELVKGSARSVAATCDLLNHSDVAVIQHEYGLYGGVDGDEVVDILGGLRVPSIVDRPHRPRDPTPHQRSVLEAVAAPRRPGGRHVERRAAPAVHRVRRRPREGRHHPARRRRSGRRCRQERRATADPAHLGAASARARGSSG